MDYFSVIVLVIVTFVFASDRKLKNLDEIKKENEIITDQINNVKSNLKIIKLQTSQINYDNILKSVEGSDKQYILIQNTQIELNETDLKTLIANYIFNKKRVSGFNLLYSFKEKKFSLKRLYVDIINYLNIFNRQELSTYGVIICKRKDCVQDKKHFKKEILSYTTTFMKINLSKEKIRNEELKRIYIERLSRANISMILKILLLIFSGSVITTNLIYSLFNINNDISGLIISGVIYYCYSYIIKYIYKPIGRQRIFASYIFPIYFLSYIIVTIYTLFTKVIKKVQAS